MILDTWLILLVLTSLSFATDGLKFDYVIVGGGTAGTVLANRVSENSSASVALIEAGGSALDNPLARTIYGNCPACETPLDWNYITTPQQYLNGSAIARKNITYCVIRLKIHEIYRCYIEDLWYT